MSHFNRTKNPNRLTDRVQHLVNTFRAFSSYHINTFLDIGCGNAEITDEIATVFKIPNVYGADVYPTLKIEPDRPVVKLTQYYQVVNNQIPLPDHSIDLITCFMSVHHFEEFQLMMREICRLLKPNGFLFLREHDVPKNNQALIKFLNDKHAQFPDHSGPIHYWSRMDLHEELTNHYHFTCVSHSDYPRNIPNRQAIYHDLYRCKV